MTHRPLLGMPGATGLLALLLAALVVASLIATGAALVRLETTQRSLGTQENESLIWTFLQMEREVEWTVRGLSRMSDPRDAAARAAVLQRYDIAMSRVEMLESSPLLHLGPDAAQMRMLLGRSVRALAEADPWFQLLPQAPPDSSELSAKVVVLDRVMADLRQLANAANHANAGLRQRLQDANANTFWALVGAVGTLLGTLAAAGVLLGRQYRGLNAAREAAERMGAELRATAEAAQAATVAKSAFLATMSHEIRTPMNGVIGSVSLLAQSRLSEAQHRLVETISACGTALLGLIDDVLDISRLESGRVELEDRPFAIRALVEAAVDIVAARVTERGIDLVAAVPPDVPAMLMGDGPRLRQVVVNLLSNAVKFTEQGGVSLIVVRAGGMLRIEVRDTGIGIAPAAMATLFDDFTQADASVSRRFGGTGLGLAICRRLVVAMGGAIGVDSTAGAGSLFHVEVPLREAVGTAEAEAETGAPMPRPVVSVATDGAAAPVGAGMAMLARELGWTAPPGTVVDVALVPAAGPAAAAPRVVRYGPGAALAPPYTAARLRQGLVRKSRVDAPAAPVPSRWAGLRVLVAEDTRVNQEVIRGLLDHLGHAAAVVADGAAAVEAVQAAVFDLVLMDMQMPRMDGITATRTIRALPGPARHLPIVALTANSFAHDRDACLEAGMDGFVAKPLTLERLRAAVDLALSVDAAPSTPGQ